MANLVQSAFNYVASNYQIPTSTQNAILRTSSILAPIIFPLENRQITVEKHPLQTLYHLLGRTQDLDSLRNALYAVPESLRNDLFFEVWTQAADFPKEGDKWGEVNALANLERLLAVIKTVAEKKFDALSSRKKSDVSATASRMAGQPQIGDELNVKSDTERLIRALHRNQCLNAPGIEISVYSDLEKDAITPSKPFDLGREELERGQICLLNGLANAFQDAYKSASELSTECAQGKNLHCVYSATVGTAWDFASGLLCQSNTITPPVLHLLDLWQDFFEEDQDSKFLQICHSRGAIEVNKALELLPPELRQRIIVVTLAAACLIPEEKAYKVKNFVIESDPVVQISANRDLLINAEHTIKLPWHSDTINPHSSRGSSYREALRPLIDSYIRTNDI